MDIWKNSIKFQFYLFVIEKYEAFNINENETESNVLLGFHNCTVEIFIYLEFSDIYPFKILGSSCNYMYLNGRTQSLIHSTPDDKREVASLLKSVNS